MGLWGEEVAVVVFCFVFHDGGMGGLGGEEGEGICCCDDVGPYSFFFWIVTYLTVYVSFIYLVAVDVWEGGTNRARGSRMPKRMRGQRGRQDRAISQRVEDLSGAGYHWYTCNFHFMISRRCRWQPEPAWHIMIPEID